MVVVRGILTVGIIGLSESAASSGRVSTMIVGGVIVHSPPSRMKSVIIVIRAEIIIPIFRRIMWILLLLPLLLIWPSVRLASCLGIIVAIAHCSRWWFIKQVQSKRDRRWSFTVVIACAQNHKSQYEFY